MNELLTQSGSAPALFEVNLIGDRVERLRRRRILSRLSDLASVIMLGVAGFFCLIVLLHLTLTMRVRLQMNRLERDLEVEQRVAQELDNMRAKTVESIGKMQTLVPVAQSRVSWAPKLAAMAKNLPAGMGVAKVNADSGELFRDPASPTPQRGGRRATSKLDMAHMIFSIVYLPRAGESQDPMGALRENMASSDAFMKKMEMLRLDATAEETWNGMQVQVFQGLLKGVSSEDQT